MIVASGDRTSIEVEGPVSAVLFDLDGTLLDTHDCIEASFRHAVATVLHKSIPTEQMMCMVGRPLDVQMNIISPQYADELCNVYRTHNHATHDTMVKIYSGVKDAVETLRKAGLPLVVATSKRHALAARGLELFGMNEYFDFILGADDVEKPKPDPWPVAESARRLGVPIEQCLYVGDSPFDMESANRAGAISVAVTWGMFEKPVLEEQQPDYMIDSPAELLEIVGL